MSLTTDQQEIMDRTRAEAKNMVERDVPAVDILTYMAQGIAQAELLGAEDTSNKGAD
jgi:hypothetical protein